MEPSDVFREMALLGRLRDYRIEDAGFQALIQELYENNPIPPSTVDAIEHHASRLGRDICASFETLQNIVSRHESLIRARWAKKTVGQRRSLLLAAWPDMPKDHMPGRGFQFLPYMNLEDLTKPKPLLLFLNSRSRHKPWTFAATEYYYSFRALMMGPCEDQDFCHSYALNITRENDPATYGQLHRDRDPSMDYHVDRDGFEICARTGIMALHIQSLILNFLATCCKLILHKKSEFEMLGAPIQTEPASIESISPDTTPNNSFSDVLILALAATLMNQKDHVWALREDPSYFADTIKEYEDHVLLDKVYQRPDASESIQRDGYRRLILRMIVDESYSFLAGWHQLDADLAGFHDMLVEGEDMARQAHAVANFIHTTIYMVRLTISRMRGAFLQSPPMRGVRLLHDGTRWKARTDRLGNMTPVQREVSEALENIGSLLSVLAKVAEGDDVWLMPVASQLAYSVEALDSVLKHSAEARGLLSGRVACMLSELSILSECLRQATLWRALPRIRYAACKEKCEHEVHNEIDDFMQNYPHGTSWLQYGRPLELLYPYQDRLCYPAHKRHTRDNNRAMCEAEANLDKFWEVIDAYFLVETGIAPPRLVQACLNEGGRLQRTVPWDDQQTPKPAETASRCALDTDAQRTATHDPASQFTGLFDKTILGQKEKVKTRGIPEPFQQNIGQHAEVPVMPQPDSVKRPIKVDKHTYKVIKILFHVQHQDIGNLARSIKWDEFKRAMRRIGFSAQQLRGSAWQFTPCAYSDAHANRGILFHEPHPEKEVPLTLARRFGRRLERAYGWSGSTFELA